MCRGEEVPKKYLKGISICWVWKCLAISRKNRRKKNIEEKIFLVHLGLKGRTFILRTKVLKNILVKVIRNIFRKNFFKKSKIKNLIIFYKFFSNILVEKKKRIINQILLNIHSFSYCNFFDITTVMLEITAFGKIKLLPLFILSI